MHESSRRAIETSHREPILFSVLFIRGTIQSLDWKQNDSSKRRRVLRRSIPSHSKRMNRYSGR